MCIVSERISVKDKATCLRSLKKKKKSEKKEKIHKAEPARMERGIMKPSKLLQSHRAFFYFCFLLLQFFADFNAKLCWNAFGA